MQWTDISLHLEANTDADLRVKCDALLAAIRRGVVEDRIANYNTLIESAGNPHNGRGGLAVKESLYRQMLSDLNDIERAMPGAATTEYGTENDTTNEGVKNND